MMRDDSRDGSREFCFFNREGNVKNGVIIECNWDRGDSITNTIVDFARHESVYVLRTCFNHRLHAETRSQFYKDERPYEVFENVNYECDENNFVTRKVARNQKKYVCDNMGNNILAVQGVCVFSEDGRCFTDIAGEVPCDEEIFSKVLSYNVTFDCWIQFNFVPSVDVVQSEPRINRITYKLHSLLQVCPDRFVFANNAPWTKQPRPMYDDNDPFAVSAEPQKVLNIAAVKAYVLVGKEIYVPSKPRCKVSLAWNQMNKIVKSADTTMQPHLPILVDLRFNDVLNRYIVYDAALRPGPMLPAEVTPESLHRVSLRPVPRCPGYFKFGNDGLAFDRFGKLLSCVKEGTKITADCYYADPDEKAYATLEVYQAHGEIPHIDLATEKFLGIHIGNNQFFCPRLHFCILRVPQNSHREMRAEKLCSKFCALGHPQFDKYLSLSPHQQHNTTDLRYTVGAWYDILLEMIHENNVVDVDAFLRTDLDHIPFKTTNGCNEFLLEAKITKIQDIDMVLSNDLGPIGMSDADFLKYENMGACGVQFPPPQKSIIDSPQVRPIFVKQYRNVSQGKSMGRYK